ncbi:MAG: hypothetical protein GF398_13610 [Chitinivibrionales bacterium]|nr:hypothetical protein [Chitinivibrionales bacterium]
MNSTKSIIYQFRFGDECVKEIPLTFDAETFDLQTEPLIDAPAWTALSFHQCPNCPLLQQEHACCPVAKSIQAYVMGFEGLKSFETADIRVITAEREYFKRDALQIGLSSMMGLLMATSGCPVLDKLRPMAYMHLPFANHRETMYRTVSMYLLSQYFQQKHGQRPDWQFRKLIKIYTEVSNVNQYFSKRLRNIAQSDANANSLVRLDCLASTITLSIVSDWWEEIEHIFHPYFSP